MLYTLKGCLFETCIFLVCFRYNICKNWYLFSVYLYISEYIDRILPRKEVKEAFLVEQQA